MYQALETDRQLLTYTSAGCFKEWIKINSFKFMFLFIPNGMNRFQFPQEKYKICTTREGGARGQLGPVWLLIAKLMGWEKALNQQHTPVHRKANNHEESASYIRRSNRLCHGQQSELEVGSLEALTLAFHFCPATSQCNIIILSTFDFSCKLTSSETVSGQAISKASHDLDPTFTRLLLKASMSL